MDRCPRLRKLLLAALMVLAGSAPAGARSLHGSIDAVTTPAGTLQSVEIRLDWPPEAEEGTLELTAAGLRSETLGYRLSQLRWSCTLRRPDAGTWGCRGSARAAGHAAGRLQLSVDRSRLDATLVRGDASLSAAIPFADAAIAIDAVRLPVDWLGPLLATLWPEARLTDGFVAAELEILPRADDRLDVSGRLSAQGFGLDTASGTIAAAGLGFDGRIDVGIGGGSGGGTRIDSSLTLRNGEILLGALYAALPAQPVQLALGMRGQGTAWQIDRFEFADGEVLKLKANGRIDIASDDWLRSARIEVSSAVLATARDRYLDSLLGTIGLSGARLAGALDATLELDGTPTSVAATLSSVGFADGQGRLEFEGLDGELAWTRSDAGRSGTLRWQGASLYGIAFGAAELPLASQGGWLRLRQPVDVDTLGGTLRVSQLEWLPGFAADDGRTVADLALALGNIDVSALSTSFGWPRFEGRLSGAIPGIEYRDGVLQFDGGLAMNVFDGSVAIDGLRMERPFGVAPTLEAEVRMRRLDLDPLTSVFGFGQISGRMDGDIRGLRLVDWQPVAFDAALRTAADGGRKRISQDAVSDLSRVGGAGLAGGLQAQLLQMFETFPYDAIGLSCRLENNVCRMGGLEPRDGGYLMVRGSGLPHITVIGHQRQVDWPVLVSRLQAATRGQGPVVD